MKRLKVIQIGIGHDHAPAVLDSLLAQPEVFDVLGLAVPPEEVRFSAAIREFSEKRGVKLVSPKEALALGDLDAAVIETEETRLNEYALTALQRGLHVHMDKPGGLKESEFAACVNLAREKQRIFHMGYMYRYNPYVMDSMRKIKSGELGEIYAVEAQMNCMHTPEKREWLRAFPGGMMFFLGCHLVDLIYRIQGTPERVLPLSCATHIQGVDAQDYGMAVFVYNNGVSFAKTCAAEPGGFLRRQLVICGEKGTLELLPFEAADFSDAQNPRRNQSTVRRYVDEQNAREQGWGADGRNERCAPFNRYDAMMRSFAEMARGERENPYSYDYELSLYRLILRACGVNEHKRE